MHRTSAGLIAAFIATIVLSALMILKGKLGLLPDMNVIHMLASHMGGNPIMGWVAHFTIGTVFYGLIYVLLFSDQHWGNHVLRAMLMATLGWLVMMLAIMPLMGAGLFGLGLPSGIKIPIATLMLHLIFGAVLGTMYGTLTRRQVN